MTSISNLIDLRKEITAAEKGAAERQATERFRHQVEDNIIELFNDPEYEQRRRSFGVIRKRFGPVFQDRDGELGEILVDMGAHVYKGEGDAALWEFSKTDEHDLLSRRRGSGWSKFTLYRAGSALVAVAIVLVGADLTLKTLGGDGLLPLVQSLTGLGQSHADCIAGANDVYLEILKCHTDHGLQ